MMLRAFALAVAMAAGCGASSATEWIDCSDGGINVGVSLLLGSEGAIVAAKLDVRDEHWVTEPAYAEGPAEPLAVLRAEETDATFSADLADEVEPGNLAELRLVKATEGDDIAWGGTVRVAGRGAWGVTCTGP